MTEIVYILTNEAMPNLVKIGCHQGDDLARRIRGLYGTGVPLPFELFYACEVKDARFVEMHIHDAFGDHRVSKSREFFWIAPERIKAALSIAAIREIKLGDEIFESAEAKAEVETAKRRSRFQFSMIGIKPGTELQLEKIQTSLAGPLTTKTKWNLEEILLRFRMLHWRQFGNWATTGLRRLVLGNGPIEGSA